MTKPPHKNPQNQVVPRTVAYLVEIKRKELLYVDHAEAADEAAKHHTEVIELVRRDAIVEMLEAMRANRKLDKAP